MITFPHSEEILLTRQRHEADRAGLHYDIRAVLGDKAYSWATKKEMPEPGKAIVLWEQPVHTSHYALSERVEIPKGQYGAGVTTLDWVRKAKVSNPENATDKFVLETKDGQRYLFKYTPNFGDKAWLFKALEKKSEVSPDIVEMMDLADKEHADKWDDWSNRSRGQHRVPIKHEGKTVGFYTPYKTGKYWRMGTTYVRPEHRGKGIGSKIIQDFFSNKDTGISYVEPWNKRSLGAFKNAGFVDTGSRTFGEGVDATEYRVMKKEPNKYLEKIALFGFSDKEKIDAANKRFHMDTWNHYSDHFNNRVKDINKEYDEKKHGDYYDHIGKTMKGDKELYGSYGKIHSTYVDKMSKLHKKYDKTKMSPKVSMDSFIDNTINDYKGRK